MKQRPISFRDDMVRAILDGRKTQTRRAVKRDDVTRAGVRGIVQGAEGPIFGSCPYGEPGDRLWVKEALEKGEEFEIVPDHYFTLYAADKKIVRDDGPFAMAWRWKRAYLPARFCPRVASRITLEITGIRVERVQEISPEDVEAEGLDVVSWLPEPAFMPPGADGEEITKFMAIDMFSELWDEINAKRGYPWADNPRVFVLEFERIEP